MILALSMLLSTLVASPIVSAVDEPAEPNPIINFFAPPVCQQYVLTFPAWYRGLTDSSCQVQINELNDFVTIPLNIIEIFIQAVAYAATGFIIWGGFKYMKSQGEPNKISEAKAAILQAVIGLVIALTSVAIVRFIQGSIL